MSSAHLLPDHDSLDSIEARILPSLGAALDALLDAAALARPGEDAALYASELKVMAHALEQLTREVEQIGPVAAQPRSVA